MREGPLELNAANSSAAVCNFKKSPNVKSVLPSLIAAEIAIPSSFVTENAGTASTDSPINA